MSGMKKPMVEREILTQAQTLTSPSPFGLIACFTERSNINFTAVSWWTYLSNRPPMLAVSLSQHSFSCACIHQYHEFTLSIVDQSLAQQALQCGKCSGRTTDKGKLLDFALAPSDTVMPGFVLKSRAAFECSTVQTVQAGDHTVFLAEIQKIHTDPSCQALYAVEGYRSLATVEWNIVNTNRIDKQ